MAIRTCVLNNLVKIPKAKVTTYAELARACHTSPRAVARILASNPNPNQWPCYKVVMSDSRIGGYSRGAREKARRLKSDGILVVNNRIDLEKHFFKLTK